MKIALAHDSFTQLGGAERVMDIFHEIFPNAPVFTLIMEKNLKEKYQAWDIRTSWLQIFYNIVPKLQYFLPVIPLSVSSLDFSGYDIVLSSSSGFIKNIKVPRNTKHINYCHTPTRFLWIDENYVNQEVPGLIRPLVKIILARMKKWDYKGAQRVGYFIANAKEVQKRIANIYHRESEVIYPPIDTDFWHPTAIKSDYFLVAGRLQAHKKIDSVIEMFNELNLPLRVVGTGRQEAYLKSIAKSNIKFLGRVSDRQLRDEYSGTKAFIYPQVEDFGLMPLEAAACGTATIAFAKGGSLETVVAGETGEFFKSEAEMRQIILNWQPDKYQQQVLIDHARQFSKEKFKEKVYNLIRYLR